MIDELGWITGCQRHWWFWVMKDIDIELIDWLQTEGSAEYSYCAKSRWWVLVAFFMFVFCCLSAVSLFVLELQKAGGRTWQDNSGICLCCAAQQPCKKLLLAESGAALYQNNQFTHWAPCLQDGLRPEIVVEYVICMSACDMCDCDCGQDSMSGACFIKKSIHERLMKPHATWSNIRVRNISSDTNRINKSDMLQAGAKQQISLS